MIGNITKGTDFGGCVIYALAEKEKDKEARLLYSEGLLTDNLRSIINGFECQASMNRRVRNCCGHISLSYSPEDSAKLDDEKMFAFALEYMELMGIKNTQFLIARHLDKEHPHCHIVFNRVDNDGKCISDSWEYFNNNDICRNLKLKYGLTFGESKDKVKVNRLKGRDKTRYEIYHAVKNALKTATDWTIFQRELAKSGVSVSKKFKKGTTEVQGLTFTKDGRKFKASQIDLRRGLSYENICEQLEANKNGHQQAPPSIRSPAKQEPSLTAKAVDAVVSSAESLAESTSLLGDLFQTGPGFDPEEEAFRRQMERRKKKKPKGPRI